MCVKDWKSWTSYRVLKFVRGDVVDNLFLS